MTDGRTDNFFSKLRLSYLQDNICLFFQMLSKTEILCQKSVSRTFSRHIILNWVIKNSKNCVTIVKMIFKGRSGKEGDRTGNEVGREG